MRLILASTSPRRRELLSLLKIPFEVHAPAFEEIPDSRLTPEQEALSFARDKAVSLQDPFPDAVIIGSDTIVELEGSKLGKPRNEAEAAKMLRCLSGKTHRVLTGLAVVDGRTSLVQEVLSIAEVQMKSLSDEEIQAYVATGEPMGKAGSYAVQGQGRSLIASVKGDYWTVVGLPLRDLAQILGSLNFKISVDLESIKDGVAAR